jgi:hypothetical protein
MVIVQLNSSRKKFSARKTKSGLNSSRKTATPQQPMAQSHFKSSRHPQPPEPRGLLDATH